jgi:dipeptidyl aminopeptidase/acylaminoacyl peptidase
MEGNVDIYVTRASGGKPIRLTADSADNEAPTWSRDGNWIYFESSRTGRWEVWKVLAGGGDAIQVTRNGGGTAFESTDGKSIYYAKGEPSGSVWKMPVGGGDEIQVLPSVCWRAFSPSKMDSILFRTLVPIEVFHPVSKLRHREGENGCSDVRSARGRAVYFSG